MKVSKSTILIFFLIFFLNCKKEESVNILKLTELENYNTKKTKINDSITKINGENQVYTLEGNINTNDNSKQDWWKIKNKVNGEKYEIEYIFLDKQIENQIKIYHGNGKLYKEVSKFYAVTSKKDGLKFDFHFPYSKFETYNVNFDYTISDTIKRKITKEGKLNCIKIDDYYSCFIPIIQNESVAGIVTNFSNFKEKDSVTLAADRMFVKF